MELWPLSEETRYAGVSILLRRFGNAAGDEVDVGKLEIVGGFLDEVADQVDRAELGIGHVEAGRVRQKVEHGAMFDRLGDGGHGLHPSGMNHQSSRPPRMKLFQGDAFAGLAQISVRSWKSSGSASWSSARLKG